LGVPIAGEERFAAFGGLEAGGEAEFCSLIFEALAETPDAAQADPLARRRERRVGAGTGSA
jgi:hypothetical protein